MKRLGMHQTRSRITKLISRVNSEWRSSVRDIHSYQGADCGSDHILVKGKVKVRFKKTT